MGGTDFKWGAEHHWPPRWRRFWLNGFAGRIWPMGRSADNPDIDYGEEWWQHTPLSKSSANAERLWFNYVDTVTIFWAGIQLLDCQQDAPVNTTFLQTPQSFSRGTQPYTFPRSTKHVYTSLACSQDFSQIWWGTEIWSVALRPQRKQHWVSPSFDSIFSRHLGLHSSWETKQRDAAVVGSFTPDPFCVWGWSICQSFGALPKRHATWHTQISRTIWRSKFP